MFAKHFLLLSMKPNLYFKSLNTSIFVSLVVPLLFLESVWCGFMIDKCKRKMPEAYFLLLKEDI